MIKSKAVSVGTSAVLLTEPETIDSIRGQTIAVHNLGAGILYLGGADVSDENGFPVTVGSSVSVEMKPTQELYCVSGSASDIRVLIEGLQ